MPPAKLLWTLLTVGSALTAPLAAAAAATPDEVLVTGTRLAATPDRVTNAVTVLTAADIDARGESSFVDLIREIPGVQVTLPGGRGGTTSIYTRGGEGNYTVFLLDGVKVNDPTDTRGGSFDFSTLALGEIERVEIVRGPQSSIYGSDALAGVINVITRAGAARHDVTTEAEAGGDQLLRGTVLLQGPLGGTGSRGGYALGVTALDDGEPVPGSHFESLQVNGKLTVESDRVRGRLFGRLADSEGTAFPEDSGGPELAVLRTLDTKESTDLTLGGDASVRITDRLAVDALATFYERDGSYTSPGVAPGVRGPVPANGADSLFRRSNATLRLAAEPLPGLATTLGADFQREDGESTGYVELGPDFVLPTEFALSRDILGAFAEARYRTASGLVLEGSVRSDKPDGFGSENTGRVGALLPFFAGRTQLRASYGTGFRLPSFFALGNPLVGNPDLRPEQSRRAIDLGVTQALGEAELGVTFFRTDYRDFIDFDPELFTNVNRPEVEARGVEFTAAAPLGESLRLQAFATYTDLDIPDSDRELLQRPEWRGGTSLRWQWGPAVQASLSWLYVGQSFDDSIPTGQRVLNDYQRVDVNLAWQATPRFRLALAVDNLLDSSYQEAIGFPAPGVRPRLTARYRFGD